MTISFSRRFLTDYTKMTTHSSDNLTKIIGSAAIIASGPKQVISIQTKCKNASLRSILTKNGWFQRRIRASFIEILTISSTKKWRSTKTSNMKNNTKTIFNSRWNSSSKGISHLLLWRPNTSPAGPLITPISMIASPEKNLPNWQKWTAARIQMPPPSSCSGRPLSHLSYWVRLPTYLRLIGRQSVLVTKSMM